MSFLAKFKATIPSTKPMMPQQQQVKIDKIPKISTAEELGNFCFSIEFVLAGHFINIGNNHNDGINNGQADDDFVITAASVKVMQS